jgi:hypothetical protein
MAATPTASYQQNGAPTLQQAFMQTPQTGTQNLDLIQIAGPGGAVLCNVDYTGAVHTPAVSATNGTRVGRFETNLTSSATTAQLFANAFTNPSLQDILQNIQEGGNISYYLNYQGVATGS